MQEKIKEMDRNLIKYTKSEIDSYKSKRKNYNANDFFKKIIICIIIFFVLVIQIKTFQAQENVLTTKELVSDWANDLLGDLSITDHSDVIINRLEIDRVGMISSYYLNLPGTTDLDRQQILDCAYAEILKNPLQVSGYLLKVRATDPANFSHYIGAMREYKFYWEHQHALKMHDDLFKSLLKKSSITDFFKRNINSFFQFFGKEPWFETADLYNEKLKENFLLLKKNLIEEFQRDRVLFYKESISSAEFLPEEIEIQKNFSNLEKRLIAKEITIFEEKHLKINIFLNEKNILKFASSDDFLKSALKQIELTHENKNFWATITTEERIRLCKIGEFRFDAIYLLNKNPNLFKYSIKGILTEVDFMLKPDDVIRAFIKHSASVDKKELMFKYLEMESGRIYINIIQNILAENSQVIQIIENLKKLNRENKIYENRELFINLLIKLMEKK